MPGPWAPCPSCKGGAQCQRRRGSPSQRLLRMAVQTAGVFPAHRSPVTRLREGDPGAMAPPHPTSLSSQASPHPHPHPQPVTQSTWLVSGARHGSLTFLFFNAGRPGRETGTGRFCILWEIVHASGEREKMTIAPCFCTRKYSICITKSD